MNTPEANLGRERMDYKGLVRLYRVFWRHYREHWKLLAFAAGGLVLSAGVHLLLPWPLKLIVDYVVLENPWPEAIAFFPRWFGGDTEWLLAALVVGFIAIRVLSSVISYFYRVARLTAAELIATDIRERLFGHLQRLSLSFHDSARSGDLVYRLTSDIDGAKQILVEAPQAVVYRLVMIVAYTVMMLALHWRLGLIAFCAIPALCYFHWRLGGGVRRAAKKKKRSESDVSSIVSETVTAMALVQAYGREDIQKARFEDENRQSVKHGIAALRLSKSLKRIADVLCAVSTAAVVYYGAVLALEGTILPGTLILFTVYLKNLYRPVEQLAATMLKMVNSQISGERLLEIVECNAVMTDAPGAIAMPTPRASGVCGSPVEFRNVSFSYESGSEVLRDVSFVARAGETVALIGPTGAGKSTLIRLLLRFHDPQEGQILVGGEDVRKITLKSLRNNITVVFQEARLFNKTVRENIAFGKADATEEEIERAARLAQAHEFIQEMPDGYDTMIVERGENLSGGQKQRLNIARAIVRNTPILVLDEPGTALDVRTATLVHKALQELTRGKTTFVVAHKLSTIVNADRILVLTDGSVVANGRHAELLATSEEYRTMYELQDDVVAPASTALDAKFE